MAKGGRKIFEEHCYMKILHFYKTAFPDSTGGIEQVISQIARGTSRLGASVEVLSLSHHIPPSFLEVDGYMIHRERLNFEIASTGFSWSVIAKFSQLAKSVDIIHYHFPWPFMDVVHFLTRTNKPTVLTYHSDIIRQANLLKLYRPLKLLFLKSVDHIVATSPNYLATSDVLQFYSHKSSVIPIGLDKSSYPIPSTDLVEFWRARLPKKFFLFIGVIRYYKGLHILLEAARYAEFPIVIVGAGEIEWDLKAEALRLGLSNVHFLGYLPDEDKVALLLLSYAIVFPSHLRSEAFGVSLLEGAMYGKPMISSEIGTGTTFVNDAGETGLVIPPGDPGALRQAMDYLWGSPGQATRMGKNAEARFLKYFTADQMTKSYMSLYSKLIERHNLVDHDRSD